MKFLLSLAFLCALSVSYGQIKPENGVKPSKAAYYALKNATIFVSPTQKIVGGTLLIKDNKVVKVGLPGIVTIPKEAVVIDCKKKVIVPAFIELNAQIGVPAAKKANHSPVPQLDSKKKGAFYWNESIHPEVDAQTLYSYDTKTGEKLIQKGFGFALTHQHDGVARGKGAFVALKSGSDAYLSNAAPTSFYSFQKGVSRQTYPSSQMGSIALLRQAFYDAQWYATESKEENLSLEALNAQLKAIGFFETKDKLEILRAAKIAEEFNLNMNYIGSGNEYESIEDLKQLDATFILPLNFPAAYDVKNPYVSRQIPLSDLKHWEMAPMNPSVLVRNNLGVCLSGYQVKSVDFWENLRKSIKHGLSQEEALRSLTLTPAKTVGLEDRIGTLEVGKIASFMIYDNNPFAEKATLLESWQLGERNILKTLPETHKVAGKYNVSFKTEKFPIEINQKGTKLSGKLTYTTIVKEVKKDTTVNLFVDYDNQNITLQFNIDKPELSGSVTLRGKINSRLGVFEGEGLLPTGEWVSWSAIRNKKTGKKPKIAKELTVQDTLIKTWFPNMAYGFDTIPESKSIIIKNATLWTNEAMGVIENAVLVIEDGKITFVGKGNYRKPSGAIVIDAEGKHITSGIIDEHSHIAISKGVNEGGQAISAEVSIGHVVNPKDINIYRQLAGGVTAAQLLHGSANPVGGQSALIKLKWGHNADEMLIDNAPKFIKFALGENVKQTNWGDYNTVRFPQTRMGVEQVYYDGFARARAYHKEMEAYKQGNGKKPRIDLELEVLNEILHEERFISCHSYIQSEINMLMHVADSMGFRLNTFTHILEGYKVADKMREHGAGGSTFSDWWAYKYEVNDAIPYNAAIMHEQGIVVAINSDDAEMGRRLNQEAAKGVKYGGMSEEDAWKMVTLNPAKLLHLDDRMGSLKVGKDADIVIWSDNPLSISAKVEKTIIDGKVLYDQQRDERLRKKNQSEKARIISKMLKDNKEGGKKKPFFKRKKGHFHCDTLGEEMSTEENHH